MTVTYLVDGEVVDPARRIAADDRGLLYGDGVYETMRAHRGRLVALDRHVARLRRSCAVMGIALDEAALSADLGAALCRHPTSSAHVRVTLTRGRGLGLSPPASSRPTRIVSIADLPVDHDEVAARGVTAITLPARFTAVPGAKTLSFGASVWARLEARRRGVDDVVGVDRGLVLEASSANVIAVVDGALRAPVEGALAGVTRALVLEVAAALMPLDEGALTTADLARASEIALTSSVRGVVSVTALDGRALGVGPCIPELRDRYRRHAQILDY